MWGLGVLVECGLTRAKPATDVYLALSAQDALLSENDDAITAQQNSLVPLVVDPSLSCKLGKICIIACSL